MSGSKRKSSGDVAGTAKKCQVTMMETKVKIIERVEQGENMVDIACSYDMYPSTISTILKNKDKIMEHVKSAVLMISTRLYPKTFTRYLVTYWWIFKNNDTVLNMKAMDTKGGEVVVVV